MIPPSYTLRNLWNHKITSLLTVIGIALVVFVYCGSLMLSNGLRETLISTGEDDNVIVIRKSSQTEVMSILNYEQAQIVSAAPEIAIDNDGRQLFTNEVFVLITAPSRKTGDEANLVVRGVTDKSFVLRPRVKLVAGRMWTDPGSEIIVGASAAEKFVGCGLGETVRFGARNWTIVGVFEAEGSGYESELWGEITQMSDAFRRPIYSSLTFRIIDTTQFAAMKERLENDRRLPVDVRREKVYYEAQSKTFSSFMNITGVAISIIFSLGAIVGAMITMYAAVANRTKEIGTLRALGFSRFSILTTFLFEAVVISLTGGAIGIAGAYFLRLVQVSTTNWDTFSEIAFNFNISTAIAIEAVIFSLIMGIVGGFLPAVRASRLKIVDSLRAT